MISFAYWQAGRRDKGNALFATTTRNVWCVFVFGAFSCRNLSKVRKGSRAATRIVCLRERWPSVAGYGKAVLTVVQATPMSYPAADARRKRKGYEDKSDNATRNHTERVIQAGFLCFFVSCFVECARRASRIYTKRVALL